MNNNIYFLDRMVSDKLADIRAEGIRSQLAARAVDESPRKIRLAGLSQFFHRVLVSLS